MTKKNQVEPSPEDYNSWYVGETDMSGETLLLEKEVEEYERKLNESICERIYSDIWKMFCALIYPPASENTNDGRLKV